MLTYHAIGPDDKGRFLTVYNTPGCDVPTVACVCNAMHLAEREAQRLNAEQLARERQIKHERDACGLTGTCLWLESVDG